MAMKLDKEEGCRTPRHRGSRIPAAVACPAAPRKKPVVNSTKKKILPKNGYFIPPDLELIFSVLPTREAFA